MPLRRDTRGLTAGDDTKKEIRLFDKIWLCLGLVALGVVCGVQAQGRRPTFMVDPS